MFDPAVFLDCSCGSFQWIAMASTVTRQDPRYPVLRRGKNARFPLAASDSVARIEVCEDAADAAAILQSVVHAGLRPTIRSGGHCYEDFVVNNPNGVLIDVSMLNQVSAARGRSGYVVGPGAVLGAVYTELYRKYNVTVPGGSCYSVGSGGHLTGGGYGLLTRLNGLSVDLITGFDILTVEADGKVVSRYADRQQFPDLYRALRGSGGGNYGLITNFYFEQLPTAPRTLSTAGIGFPWDTMTEEKFIEIAQTYGHYLETSGKDPETWPLFSVLGLSHKSPTGRIMVTAAWHDVDGTNDLSIVTEFLDRFQKCGEATSLVNPPATSHGTTTGRAVQEAPCVAGKHHFRTSPWIDATIGNSGGAGANNETRGKYKSAYMKKNFTTSELKRMYQHLTREIPGVSTGWVIAVDSYGGAVNKPYLAEETSIPQRASIMKLQYQMYWQDAAEDGARLKYFDEAFTDIYSANVGSEHAGTPFHNEFYEGCYINYPDLDMTRYPFWRELYYGNTGLYPFLQGVKKKYDPNNIFHHGMAVRA